MAITRNQLRAGRILAGLAVRELAEFSGVSATAISLMETGKTREPHRMTMRRLRDALQEHGIEFKRGGWVRHEDDIEANEDGDGDADAQFVGDDARERALLLARQLVRLLGGGMS